MTQKWIQIRDQLLDAKADFGDLNRAEIHSIAAQLKAWSLVFSALEASMETRPSPIPAHQKSRSIKL